MAVSSYSLLVFRGMERVGALQEICRFSDEDPLSNCARREAAPPFFSVGCTASQGADSHVDRA
jgi:hypothetical protein